LLDIGLSNISQSRSILGYLHPAPAFRPAQIVTTRHYSPTLRLPRRGLYFKTCLPQRLSVCKIYEKKCSPKKTEKIIQATRQVVEEAPQAVRADAVRRGRERGARAGHVRRPQRRRAQRLVAQAPDQAAQDQLHGDAQHRV
jgi:hypothetical protein